MRNLTLEEIKSKNFKEFCEFNNYDIDKIIYNLGSSFSVALLDEDDEYTSLDMNYPYYIYNPFCLDIKAE